MDPEDDVGGGEVLGLPSVGAIADTVAKALSQGRVVARELARLGEEAGRIVTGGSDLAPAKGDRRFGDPAWSTNPVYRRVMQGHLATSGAVDRIVDGLADGPDGARRLAQARFVAGILTSALAPTNFLVTNPAALKHAFDTGGSSVVRGVRNLVADVRHNGGMPSTAPPGAFAVGRDLAVTAGAVVARSDVAEVLQYTPVTDTVHERPVLVIPPPIGRFYFLDLRPGRSFVEFALGREFQTFLVSWRNPTADQGDWDLDTYASAVIDAIDTVCEITGSPDVNLVGFCAGGIISTGVLNHLAAGGDDRIHSMSYAVTLLDFADPAPIAAFSDGGLLSYARKRSQRAGIITSRQMGAAFTWLRPDDLVFHYWVNNYLMGQPPPAFDILSWNADGTNLPGALHVQFLDIFERNAFAEPDGTRVLGTPLQLGKIEVPTFVTGAISDHLTPWRGCFRTTQLLGGDSTFVLSYSGHIASLVNPPGNAKAHYWTRETLEGDPQAWLNGATRQEGSWWDAWADWLRPRAGALQSRAAGLGSIRHPAQDAAPGLYVRDLSPRDGS